MSALDWLTVRPIAHRGYHDAGVGRIENTLAAAAAAVERDFAIECDLRITADDRVVVFHDDTLDRLTVARAAVDRTNLDDLKAVRFKGGDGRIPTLEELLDVVDGRVPLVIELKGASTRQRRLVTAVAQILSTYSGAVAIMSFDAGSMAAMRRLAPNLPRGLTADDCSRADWPLLSTPARFSNRHLLGALSVLPGFIAYRQTALPASAPLALRHFFGLPLLTWTVRSAGDRAAALRWADQIIFEGFDPDAG